MTSTSTDKNTVIVYRGQVLPYSETFVRAQVLALKRWHAILVGETRLKSGLSLSHVDSRLPFPSLLPRLHRVLFRAFKYKRRVYPPVANQLRNYGAKLIHAHFGPSALDIWPYAKALGLPLLVTLHGYDITIDAKWWESGEGGEGMRRYPEELRALAKEPQVRFLAVSRFILEKAVEFGIPRERVDLSYIGIDLAQFRPGLTPIQRRPLRVLFVGRLVEKKGAGYVIEAISRLSQSLPNVELVLVGDGPLHETLQNQAVKAQARVTFKGALPADAVHREMAAARILCLPSVTASNGDAEGLGQVLIEAQAAGLPVVTSAKGGADEVVKDGISGFRFAEKDVDSLATHLGRLLRDDELLSRMSSAAIKNASERFDIRSCIGTVEAAYEEQIRLAS